MFNIFIQERYLTREQLIVRVEGKLGSDCYGGAAWVDTFYRDMQVVKRAVRAAGYQPAYRRNSLLPGYYLRDQPPISSVLAVILDGSISEVDPSQIEIFKQLSYEQRFRQACSISNLALQVVANRILARDPGLDRVAAHRLAVQSGSQR